MKVTIIDVARAADVAKSTVSKVMNDSPKISEATKAKVRKVMKELNYTPSSVATQLARQKTYNIGLLIDMSQGDAYLNPYFYNVIVGIESVIGPREYDLTVINIQTGEGDDERYYLKRLVMGKRIDGLITNNSILTLKDAKTLNQLSFPFLSMGEYTETASSWLDIDNEDGSRKLTNHLIAQGYRKIAFIGGEEGEYIFTRRFQGYAKEMKKAGLPVREEWCIQGAASEAFGYSATQKLLSVLNSPDAIICMNNQVAYGVLKAAEQWARSIPDELGIVKFDDDHSSLYLNPPLTSLYMNTFELGAKAGEMILDRIYQPEAPPSSLLLEPIVYVRESTQRSGL